MGESGPVRCWAGGAATTRARHTRLGHQPMLWFVRLGHAPFQCPGPARCASALLASRLDITDPQLAWMSPVVRHRLASPPTQLWQPCELDVEHVSTDMTMGRPPPEVHASKPLRNAIQDVLS